MEKEKQNKINIFKKFKFNPIVLIISLIILILIFFLGFGVVNGSSLRKYSQRSQEMLDSTKDWDKSLESDENPSATKNKIEKIKYDSEKYLIELEDNAPKKNEKLQSYLKEYFNLSKNISGETVKIIDWSIDLENALKNTSDLSSLDSTSTESIILSLETTKKNTESMVLRLKKITPPKTIKYFHNSFIDSLSQMINVYQKLIDAVKTNNIESLSSISSELSAIENKIGEIPDPGETVEKEYQDDLEKITNLEELIQSEIDIYKNTFFSY